MLTIQPVNTTDADYRNLTRMVGRWRNWLIVQTRRKPLLALPPAISWPGITPDDVWGRACAASKDGPTLYVVRGAGGFAGGHPDARTAVVGDVVLGALAGHTDWVAAVIHMGQEQATPDAQTGAALHEALHLYRLTHEMGGVMAEWWDWPKTELPLVPLGTEGDDVADLFGRPANWWELRWAALRV